MAALVPYENCLALFYTEMLLRMGERGRLSSGTSGAICGY